MGTFSHQTFNGGPAFGPDSSGAFNMSFTDPGADNLIAITVTDGSSAVTSGYLQPFYANITLDSDASWSTGSAQINAFATDITLDGTVSCEVEGMYVYITNSSGTITSANISGLVVNIADLGSQASTRAGLQIHIEDGNVAASQDAAILVRLEGSSGALTNLIQLSGTASLKPAYFLTTNQGGAASTMVQSKTCAGTQDTVLVCNINGSTYWIPMYAASD